MGASETNSSVRKTKTAPPGEYDVSTSKTDERIARQDYGESDVYHNVKVDELPSYLELKQQVDAEIARMNWWESYGIDSMIHLGAVVAAVASFFIMKSDSLAVCAFGIFVLGCCHNTLAVKGGHLAAHRAAVQSAPLNRLLGYFFSDMCGTFPSEAGVTVHVKEHHPYTNIIGKGDSSTWKAPAVPTYLYLFFTPLLIPVITPFVSVALLWGQWLSLLTFLTLASLGLSINFYLFVYVSGFSFLQAVLLTLVSRAVLAIPYIHVNVFQHIGLAMYTLKDKPKKIYQMSTGVLNLSRNPLLDFCFGHSIIRYGEHTHRDTHGMH